MTSDEALYEQLLGGDMKAFDALYERQRACTDAFIPALVEEALAEWKSDSTDAAIATTCDRMASSPMGATALATSDSCVAAPSCGAFVDCIIPLMRKQL
jgi:hypothetical protein